MEPRREACGHGLRGARFRGGDVLIAMGMALGKRRRGRRHPVAWGQCQDAPWGPGLRGAQLRGGDVLIALGMALERRRGRRHPVAWEQCEDAPCGPGLRGAQLRGGDVLIALGMALGKRRRGRRHPCQEETLRIGLGGTFPSVGSATSCGTGCSFPSPASTRHPRPAGHRSSRKPSTPKRIVPQIPSLAGTQDPWDPGPVGFLP
jgi:hypothetical protein